MQHRALSFQRQSEKLCARRRLISLHSAVNHHRFLILHRSLETKPDPTRLRAKPRSVSRRTKCLEDIKIQSRLQLTARPQHERCILTIEPAVPLGEGSQEELAALLHGLQEVSLALQGQRLLHLTGAAGVVLRTEAQVLPYNAAADLGLDQSVLQKH